MYFSHLYVAGFFFFSSRRRHTRYIGDWSSDVCSSDLCRSNVGRVFSDPPRAPGPKGPGLRTRARTAQGGRSEERRVGKECRWRWGAYEWKKKSKCGGDSRG